MKFVFWFYLFTQFGLSYIFAGIEKFYYRLPDENGFSLVGRSSVVRESDGLYLYKYVERTMCEEVNVETKITYKKIGKINCARLELIKAMPKLDFSAFYQYQNNIPTVIMYDSTVVYLDIETNGLTGDNRKILKWDIMAYKDGVNSLVKEYKIFELGQFTKNYQLGKVKFDESIKEQTGVIWSENFKVIDQNTIGFLDLMIVTVDNEKPTEAIVRERQLNIFTGEETMRERDLM